MTAPADEEPALTCPHCGALPGVPCDCEDDEDWRVP